MLIFVKLSATTGILTKVRKNNPAFAGIPGSPFSKVFSLPPLRLCSGQNCYEKFMKIALLSPIAWRTPPRHYGPWEQMVSILSEGLVRKGLDVTLFATGDSITKARLRSIVSCGYEEGRDLDPKVWECLHISNIFEQANEYDIIHNHFDFLPLTYTDLVTTPILTTIHGFSSSKTKILPVYKKYNGRAYYVSISDADRSRELNYVATVHHGIEVEKFSFREQHGEYLLFFGRIHHEKGTYEAIQVAKRFDIPVCADGGMKTPGDVAKAIGAGASSIFSGFLFAGTDEAPGMIIMKDGKRYKKYMGSASYDSGHERKELQEGKKVRERLDIFVEGVSILMDYKGVVEDVIHSIIKGVQSAMSYSGARNIMEMHQNTELIQLTSAGWEESKAQGMKLNE